MCFKEYYLSEQIISPEYCQTGFLHETLHVRCQSLCFDGDQSSGSSLSYVCCCEQQHEVLEHCQVPS